MAEQPQLAVINCTTALWLNKGLWSQSCCICTRQTHVVNYLLCRVLVSKRRCQRRGEWVEFCRLLFNDPLSQTCPEAASLTGAGREERGEASRGAEEARVVPGWSIGGGPRAWQFIFLLWYLWAGAIATLLFLLGTVTL